ncbi:MAG: hypothetical protein PHX77_03190, partial [Candidatus Bipolaricaulis sp.]|nr:hypothetical protein [Candidatus Bipolaricaulis sp.]
DGARVLDFDDPDNSNWLPADHPTVAAGGLIAERRAAAAMSSSRNECDQRVLVKVIDRAFRSAEHERYHWPLATLAIGRPPELQSADAYP